MSAFTDAPVVFFLPLRDDCGVFLATLRAKLAQMRMPREAQAGQGSWELGAGSWELGAGSWEQLTPNPR